MRRPTIFSEPYWIFTSSLLLAKTTVFPKTQRAPLFENHFVVILGTVLSFENSSVCVCVCAFLKAFFHHLKASLLCSTLSSLYGHFAHNYVVTLEGISFVFISAMSWTDIIGDSRPPPPPPPHIATRPEHLSRDSEDETPPPPRPPSPKDDVSLSSSVGLVAFLSLSYSSSLSLSLSPFLQPTDLPC